jgi:hypothetical protein
MKVVKADEVFRRQLWQWQTQFSAPRYSKLTAPHRQRPFLTVMTIALPANPSAPF